MAYLSHIQSLWSSTLSGLSQVADIYVRDGISGPVLVLRDATTQTETTLALTGGAISTSTVATAPFSGTVDLVFGGVSHSIDASLIGDLSTSPMAERGYLDGSSFAGLSARFVSVVVGGEELLYAARSYGQGISTFTLGGAVSFRAETADTAGTHLSGVTGLAIATVGPAQFLVSASGSEDGLSIMRIGPGGALEETHSVSTAEGVPIDAPSGLLTLEIAGETYVVVSASGTSSLSVFRLDGNGRLTFADQVSDTLKTRFQGATAIDAINFQGRSLIAVGGNDGGLSLLQLLPGGQLLHLDTIIDQTGSALSGIRDLQFAETSTGLQLFALTTGDKGLGQFAVNLPPAHQVILDENGAGSMSGTAGADIFVVRPDQETDEILGFDPGADKIDLSIFDLVASVADIGITQTSDGARLVVGDEVLVLRSANGAPLTYQLLADRFLFDLDHTSMSDPGFSGAIYGTSFSEALHGSTGNDRIESRGGADWITPGAGNDIIDGGAGRDMVSYFDLTGPVRIDLSLGMAWAAGKTDQLISIEGATGSIFADYIVGDAGSNRLRGLGNTDWFIGSGGGDSFDGGNSRDMVSYAYAPEGVIVDLAKGKGLGGQALGDTYFAIERITGSSFPDLLIGGSGADEFRGLGGDDWFVGSGSGRDRFDGGAGNDTVSYAFSKTGITASLLLGRGSVGDATSDRYANIENLTGSSFADRITGDHGANVLRGLGGKDRIFGNGGDDRITGGGSDDVIDGGEGQDYAYYSGPRDDYEIGGSDGVTTVLHLNAGFDGFDTLTNVEFLVFDDLWITL